MQIGHVDGERPVSRGRQDHQRRPAAREMAEHELAIFITTGQCAGVAVDAQNRRRDIRGALLLHDQPPGLLALGALHGHFPKSVDRGAPDTCAGLGLVAVRRHRISSSSTSAHTGPPARHPAAWLRAWRRRNRSSTPASRFESLLRWRPLSRSPLNSQPWRFDPSPAICRRNGMSWPLKVMVASQRPASDGRTD